MCIRDSLTTDVLTVPPDATTSEFVYLHVLGRRQRSVPVVDKDNYLGMISLSDLSEVERSSWDETPVSELLRNDLPVARPSWSLRDTVAAMEDYEIDVLAVTDESNAFIGVVYEEDILKLDEILEETGG